jgi:hypothetical protein
MKRTAVSAGIECKKCGRGKVRYPSGDVVCPGCRYQRQKARRNSSPERKRYHYEGAAKWRKDHPEKHKEIVRKKCLRRKTRVLAHYSNGQPPTCACCAIKDIEFLSLDHVNNDGADHRRGSAKGQGGQAFYCWIIRHGFPEGYRVLCFNCNWSFGAYGYCPHQKCSNR